MNQTWRELARAELWLVDVLNDGLRPYSHFKGNSVTRAAAWQRGPYVPTAQDVAAAIQSLWRRGLLAWADDDDYATIIDPFPTQEVLPDDRPLGLTALGGLVWEGWAQPEWSLFYEDAWGAEETADGESERGVITLYALSETRLWQLLFLGEAYWGLHFHRDLVKITPLSPYRPVYWKDIGSGFSCRVTYDKRQDSWDRTKVVPSMTIWRRRAFNPNLCLEWLDNSVP